VMQLSPAQLASAPLWSRAEWPEGGPDWALRAVLEFQNYLIGLQNNDPEEHWDVWQQWYSARLMGGNAFGLTDAAAEQVETGILLLRNEVWKQGPKMVNRAIKALIDKARAGETALDQDGLSAQPVAGRSPATLQEVADLVSPQPVLTDNKLDAVPNRVFDKPVVDDDLATLPIRQKRLIEGVILPSLSPQTPKQLRFALQAYADELTARGTQPILGLLADMRAIITADLHAAGARAEWLEEGMVAAFGRFEANDKLFEEHFPLDAEREEAYAATPVNEEAATGPALSKPFEELQAATHAAHEAGLTTDNFRKVVDGMAESAKIIATLPPPSSEDEDTLPMLRPEDRPVPKVSARKRKVLSGVGFAGKNIELMAATAGLMYSPPGLALQTAFEKLLFELLKLM
jgi:hypothetical protein